MNASAPSLSNFRLILVAPRTPGNVGATARAAANFACEDVWVVAAACDWRDGEGRKYATGAAGETFARIREASDLAEALADCTHAIGFSRRQGKTRRPSIGLGAVGALGAPNAAAGDSELTPAEGERTALVFGNEETGLSNEDLGECTHLCAIETSPAMGSLNLSHAVAVVLARLYEEQVARAQRARPGAAGGMSLTAPRSRKAAPIGELDAMTEHWQSLIGDIGLTAGGNPARLAHALRAIFARARVSSRDVRLIRGLVSKIQVRLGTRARGQRIT